MAAIVAAATLTTVAAVAQPRETGGRDLEVQRVSGRCGENAVDAPPRPATVTARSTRRGVVVAVRNYVFNCGQVLGFTARVDARTVVLTARGMGGSVASCVCFHDARVLVKGLEPGDYEIKIDTGESRTVLGPGGRGLVSERVYATGRVSVR